MDPLSRYVDELLTPCIMVAASEEAQRICAKSSLSFAQLLRPCGFLQRIDVPLRIGDRALRLHDLNMRFYDAAQMRQIGPRETEDLLRQVLHETLDRPQIPGARSLWYRDYLNQLNRCCLFTNQYSFDLPTCVLLVLPTTYPGNVVEGFQQLWQQTYAQLPEWLKTDEADLAHVTRIHVLLNDASNPEPVHGIEVKLQQMQKAFQPGHHQYLTINSLPVALENARRANTDPSHETSAKPPPETWSSLVNPRAPGGGAGEPSGSDPDLRQVGSLITGSDFESLKSFVERIVVRCILPEVEARARSVNQHVNNTRRGLKNQIRSLWYKSIGGGGEEKDGVVKSFGLSTQEGQMHWLADLALMLRDFELAISTYKLLIDDYKNERAWRHMAAVYECMALAQALSDQPLRDVENSFINALQTYTQAGMVPGNYLMAARCGILMAEYYRTADRKRESISAFLRVAQDPSPIRAALMLEQVAYGYLDIGMGRRFVFHMVLAGHKAMEGGQGQLAGQLYEAASKGPHYPGASWSFVDEHVQGILARFTEGRGDARAFIGHVQQLLRCGHQPANVQLQELRTLEQAVRIAVPEEFLPELWLPEVTASSAFVAFDDYRCMRAQGEQEGGADAWFPNEDALITVPGVSASAVFDLAAKTTVNGHPAHLCVAGEVVSCTVEFANPLGVPILIERAKLICEFEADVDTGPSPSPSPMQRSAPASALDLRSMGPSEADAPASSSGSGANQPSTSAPTPPPGSSPRSAQHGKSFSVDLGAQPVPSSAPDGSERPLALIDEAGPLSPKRAAARPHPPAPPEVAIPTPGLLPDGSSPLEFLEETFSLKGGEKTVLTLRVRPRVAGTFRILGVEWRLQGAVKGKKMFDFKDIPRRKGALPSRNIMRFKVIPPMPRLEARLLHMPEILYCGELRRCEWEAVNEGQGALHGLRVASLQEDVLLGATAALLPASASVHSGDRAVQEVKVTQVKPGLYMFPSSLVLEPGDRVRISLWMHPPREGLFSPRVSWYFEAVEPHKRMKGRFLHYSHVCPVLPALHVDTHASQSTHEIGSVLLDLSLENSHRLDSVTVTQVRAPDNSWIVTDLNRLDRASGPDSESSSGSVSRSDLPLPSPLRATPGKRAPRPRTGLELRPEANGLMYFLLQPSGRNQLPIEPVLEEVVRTPGGKERRVPHPNALVHPTLSLRNGDLKELLSEVAEDPLSPPRVSSSGIAASHPLAGTPASAAKSLASDPLSAFEDYDEAEEWAVRRFFKRFVHGGQAKIFSSNFSGGGAAVPPSPQKEAGGPKTPPGAKKTPGKKGPREEAKPQDPPLFVAIHWQSRSKLERVLRSGVHFLGPVDIKGRSVVQLQTPTKLTVAHDFSSPLSPGPCVVRIPVGVFNTCAAPIDIELDVTGPPKEVARGLPAGSSSPWSDASTSGPHAPASSTGGSWGPGPLEPFQAYQWVGVRRRLVRGLQGREMANFVLHAAINSPGEHSLSGYIVNFRAQENSLGKVIGQAITVLVQDSGGDGLLGLASPQTPQKVVVEKRFEDASLI